ncbi:hypothetical protein TRVA0_031S00210 [Trichomonascus vanleenenianus]|uniref:uncharacterized protein n=1 Tax=Trichomonascus vanleenenianus TaxID=2268995 RepID=UPI003ECB7152
MLTNLDRPDHPDDDDHRRRRESVGSGDSSAPTVEEGNDSSEAETVILPEHERRRPDRKKHHSIKRLQRRIPSSSSSDEEEDRKSAYVRRRTNAKLNHQRKPSGSKSSRSASPAQHGGSRKTGKLIRDPSGRLPLQKMCDRGDYDRAKELIEAGADVNDRDYAGNTAIHDAALKGHVKIVELLLDHGAIIDIRSGVDELETPLIDAAAANRVDVVKLLLDRGADPRIYNKQGKTALDSIPEDSPEYDELERLLKEAAYRFRKARRGSEASTSDNNASRNNNNNNNNNDIDQATNFDPSNSIPGTFPPELTRKKSDESEPRSSAAPRRRGARSQSIRNDLLWMDLTTRSGREQVYRKAADGDIQYVGKSLEEGWVPDGQSISLAAKHGHTDLVGLLLAFGGNSDALNNDGETAMEQTIGRGHLDTIKLLLKSGADPLRKDKRGRSYYDIAREAVGSDDEETMLIQDAMDSALDEKKQRREQPRAADDEHRDKKRKIKRESPSEFGKEKDKERERAKKAKEKKKESDRGESQKPSESDKTTPRRLSDSDKIVSRKPSDSDKAAASRRLSDPDKAASKKPEDLESRSKSQKPHSESPDNDSRLDRKQRDESEARQLEKERKATEERKRELEERKQRELEERKQRELEERELEEQKKREALEKEKEEEERKRREALEKEKERKQRELLAAQREKERKQREALEAQKEKERKQREALEAQKEKERRRRELQMLKSLEEDEKRKREARRRAEEEEVERQHQQQLEAEKRKELEEERQRALSLKKDAEQRKKYPYGVRIGHFGPGHTIEHMQSFLPLLVRSFDSTAKLPPNPSSSDLSQFYFVDVQISLFLGVQNLYHAYPDLTKKLVTDQEKNRMWSMLVPWICRRVHPFDEAPLSTEQLLAERSEDKKRFCAMTVFWLKVEQVVDILRRDFGQAYQLFNSTQLVHMDLDYGEGDDNVPNGDSVWSHLPSRMRVKMEYPTWQ